MYQGYLKYKTVIAELDSAIQLRINIVLFLASVYLVLQTSVGFKNPTYGGAPKRLPEKINCSASNRGFI
ncbi:hypothetical protein [Paralysiella testudinis]|uniref:Uncharacterized protein n=1 Tax=Paralysiella testudinis TaxID=2809020 RepID=A0A892ZLY0_9NEIS|nr:hypothetical protein [Paralysiella testudinis]QRQ82594.1 hypothetical protein JQU52_04160 [Paralysiella testudinis]